MHPIGKVALLLPSGVPFVLLFIQLWGEVVFATKAVLVEGTVVSVALEKVTTVVSGRFEIGDSIDVHLIPSVDLEIPNRPEGMECKASGMLSVFGKLLGNDERLVQKELDEIKRKIHVPVYYQIKGNEILCKLNTAVDKRKISGFIVSLLLTVSLPFLLWRKH